MLTQIYEWGQMILIITDQKFKFIGQALEEMSDTTAKNKFYIKELKLKFVYFSTTFILIIVVLILRVVLKYTEGYKVVGI